MENVKLMNMCKIIDPTTKKVLVQERIKSWKGVAFPGGKIESGETKEEALVREIKEELNCNINIEKFITTIDYEYNTFSLTMHVYLCSLKDNEPILLEHKSSIWCDKDKLNDLAGKIKDEMSDDEIKMVKDGVTLVEGMLRDFRTNLEANREKLSEEKYNIYSKLYKQS